MADSLHLRCCVCMENYSHNLIPRNLECGHALCTDCTKGILKECDNTCPECRECFVPISPDELTVNYSVLRLSQIYNFASANTELVPVPNMIIANPPSEPIESAGTCPVHGFSMFYTCLRCCVFVCRGCLVTDHLDSPYGSCMIADIKKAMNKIKLMHQKTLKLYLEQAEELRIKLLHIVRGCAVVIQWFGKDMNSKESENVRGAVEMLTKEKEEAELQIPILKEIIELLQQTPNKIDEASQCEAIMAAHVTCLDNESVFETFMGKQKEWEMHIFLQPFLHGKENIKELVVAGKPVYATQTEEDGKNRWSQVVCEDGMILLRSLRDGIPPEDGVNLPFAVLRAAVPQNSPWIFIDLDFGDIYNGRIFIKLFGDTPRGRHALLLCSGEKGPCYRNTSLLNQTEGEEQEYISGGDCDKDDGSRVRAIADDIVDDDRETRALEAGMLVGYPAEEQGRLTSFKLYLDDHPDVHVNHAFGIATEGLYNMRHIRYQGHLKGRKQGVKDCGLVIPWFSLNITMY